MYPSHPDSALSRSVAVLVPTLVVSVILEKTCRRLFEPCGEASELPVLGEIVQFKQQLHLGFVDISMHVVINIEMSTYARACKVQSADP